MTKKLPEAANWLRITYQYVEKMIRLHRATLRSLEEQQAALRRTYEEEYPDLPPIGEKLR